MVNGEALLLWFGYISTAVMNINGAMVRSKDAASSLPGVCWNLILVTRVPECNYSASHFLSCESSGRFNHFQGHNFTIRAQTRLKL